MNSRIDSRRQGAILVALLICAVAVGVLTRWWLLSNHFTHIDDIGVAWTILKEKNEYELHRKSECVAGVSRIPLGCIYLRAVKQAEELGQPSTGFGEFLERNGALQPLRRAFFFYKAFHVVPLTWTFAPVQFYVTGILLAPGMSYEQIKFWGRFPSFVFGVLAIGLMGILIARIRAISEPAIGAGLAMTFMALSWQNIIYSAQMESYSIGVFSVAILLLALQYILERREASRLSGWGIGLLLGGLAMCQYQLLVFYPGFIIAILYGDSTNANWKDRLRFLVQVGVGFCLLAVPFVFTMLWSHWVGNTGINWNAGPQGEFMLGSVEPSIVGYAIGVAKVLAMFPYVLEAMLSPVAEDSIFLPLLRWVYFILLLVGIWSVARDKERKKRAMLVFTISLAVTWLFLLIARKVTLSPTRHSMVLTPVFVMFVTVGVVHLIEMVKTSGARRNIALAVALGWLGLFTSTASAELGRRQDPFDELSLAMRISGDQADLVVGKFPNSPFFMPLLAGKYPVIEDRWHLGKQFLVNGFSPSETGKRLVVAYYGSSALSPDSLMEILRKVGFPASQDIFLLSKKETQSGTEIDWSSHTRNGTNRYFYYLYAVAR